MSTPVLYKANETNFNTLGLGALPDSLSSKVYEEINGQFYLEMEHPIDSIMFKEFKNDRLIKADASNDLKQQRFKIVRITKPSKGIVKIYAEHISYHTQEMQLKPLVAFNGNATTALNAWKNNIVTEHPFTIYSDISFLSKGSWTIENVENARKALGGVEGSLLDIYGGEYRFDNYHIGLYQNRGNDNGALIAYGKNLTELEQEEEIADTYTSVYPFSIFTNEKTNVSSMITLPEFFVDSQFVGNYARRKILLVNFSDDKISTVAQLRSRAAQYITSNQIGVPKINLAVKFVDLAKTLDYKHLKLIEEINIGDWVNIYFDKLGVRSKAKVIKTVWNILLDRYDEIELGDSRASLSQSIGSTVDGKLETVTNRLNIIQISADGKTKTYRGIDEPLTGNVGDLWYKPIGDGQTEMYQHDGSIWAFVMSTATLDQVEKDVASAITEIGVVSQAANDAVANADKAIEDVGFLKPDVAAAKANALLATEAANTATANAATAITNATTAIETANAATGTANTAATSAASSLLTSNTAIANAQSALNAYNNLEIGARNLIISSSLLLKRYLNIENGELIVASTHNATDFIPVIGSTNYILSANKLHQLRLVYYDENKQFISGFLYESDQGTEKIITTPFNARFVKWSGDPINGSDLITWKFERGTKATDWTPAPEDVQIQITDINGELSRKASQTSFDTLNGTVSSQSTLISQSQTAIGLKADSSVVNLLSGTVSNHTAQIKVASDGLALKADSSVVNTLSGTVNTHTTQIKATSDGLALKADSSVVNTLSGTVSTHTTQIKATSDGLALKADSTTVNGIKSTVESHTTQITATSNGLALKADTTLVNTIKGTVDSHTTQITAANNAITLKADSSLVNTINGTVSTHTAQIKVVSDGLALKAESSLVNTISGTVSTHTTQIAANSTAINLRLTSAQVDSLVTGKNYVNQTTLNATSSSLNASITQVSTDLSNLEIGGRNYFKKSTIVSSPIAVQELARNSTIATEGFYVVGASGGNSMVRLNNVITDNGWWTVSFDIKGNQSVVIGFRVQIADLGTTQIYSNADNTFTRVSVTVNVTNYTSDVYNFVDFEGVPNNFIWIDKIKVEKGNKATDWTPAPEDMATLEKFTTLNATVDGIQTIVGTKASQTQVTQLAGQITTKVESSTYNSKMTQLDNAINLRVQASDVTAAILSDKTIKDTRSVNQLPSWYNSNYPKQSITEFKERAVMGVAGIAYYGQLETKVIWGSTSGGAITQVFSSSDGVFQRTSNAAYTAWNAWDQVIEASELLSQINVQAGKILIQTGKLYLDAATVTFSGSAFIPSAAISTLDAGKITAGTLNAANVNLINLNVSKLVGDTSNFVQSAWNSAAGGGVTITGGGIQSTGSNGYNALLQNGVLYIKDPEGRGVGTVGGATTDASNTFSIDLINPNNFMIRETFSDGRKNEIFSFKTYLNKFSMQKDLEIAENLTVKKDIFASQRNIYDVNFITFGSGQSTLNSIYSATGGYQRYAAPTGFRWDMGGYQAFVLARSGTTNNASMYAHLNMQGYNITNQSDRRLKTKIKETKINALSLFRKYDFVGFEWKSKDKPQGEQFGLIAQDTPFISEQNKEGVWNINTSKQIMLNSLGIKELDISVLKVENEIEVLKKKIQELELKIA